MEDDEREIRAARSQALFRAVNEQMRDLNDSFVAIAGGTFTIACECADVSCIEVLELPRDAYEQVRRSPRTFAVLPGHIYPDIERVVDERDSYVVVEKLGRAAAVVEGEHLESTRRRASD